MPHRMHNAPFIVLEGIDGAGTTTHTARLVAALRERELVVHATREPSDGPVGVLLRQILTGRVVTGAPTGVPGWSTLGLLFGADRLDHLEAEILPKLQLGVTVVCDRYDYSTVAYQSLSARGVVTPTDAIAWLRQVNHFARRPDLTIVLDVPPEVARLRRMSRVSDDELFDDDALQRELSGFYARIEQHFPEDHVVHIGADRAPEPVAADVIEAAMRVHSCSQGRL